MEVLDVWPIVALVPWMLAVVALFAIAAYLKDKC